MNILKYENLFQQSYITNFFLAFLFIVQSLYLNIKFSGRPFITEKHKQKIVEFRAGLYIWGIGRLLAGGSDALF